MSFSTQRLIELHNAVHREATVNRDKPANVAAAFEALAAVPAVVAELMARQAEIVALRRQLEDALKAPPTRTRQAGKGE
jgi:hypothetical protein